MSTAAPTTKPGYIAKREKHLVEQARLYYKRQGPRTVNQIETADGESRHKKTKSVGLTNINTNRTKDTSTYDVPVTLASDR